MYMVETITVISCDHIWIRYDLLYAFICKQVRSCQGKKLQEAHD